LPVACVRLSVALAVAGSLAGAALAAPAAATTPIPQSRPASAATAKPDKHAKQKVARHPAPARKGSPASAALTPQTAPIVAVPPVPSLGQIGPPVRPTAPLATTTAAAASPIDLGAVKQAIDLVHKDRQDEATNVENTISDPIARKLVEWVVLRDDDSGGVAFSRYAAFIAANPSWPSIVTLRRRAEVALWEQQVDPQMTIDFFASDPPSSAKGFFALARAWLIRGDVTRARAAVRTAWRDTGFSDDIEAQARQIFGGLITPADDKARMDARLYVGDGDAGIRAARHLDPVQFAIARARAAVTSKAGDAKALLDAVPAAAQHDPGYMFSRIQWLRHTDKIKDAAQWMLAAPREPDKLVDLDQWWIERRLVARKLLDLGDAKTAYEIADGGPAPTSDNYRAEQQFTAGWIALRFLDQPAVALPHFARITEGVFNPITLARSFYWQGRAAEALQRTQEARSLYEAAGRYPTAYYGQLALARLHLDDIALREPLQPPAERGTLELGRAFEILYAIDEPDIIAGMAADTADKTSDIAGLAALAEITSRHNDARATLLIGKTALGRGFPFERYAFPDFGVPNYRPIGPAVERAVVYSIVRQESAFNTRVISSAHALGLMQVTPAAGRNTAKKFNVPFDQRRLLADVAYNVQLGAAELGDDLNTYRGSYILAFAGYNAGQHRVSEWLEQYGDPRDRNIDPIDWIERIPFSETRNYVERIIENMQVYRARLENNPKLLIEADLRRGG
jgi:soluble lytic murein transglycosylase